MALAVALVALWAIAKVIKWGMIDEIARDRAITHYAIPESLHVPIGAVDEMAITTHVGRIERVLSGGPSRKAFLVQANAPPPRDVRLPIWGLSNSGILYQPLQVWADLSYTRYRRAYYTAFPDEDFGDLIISHTMNRRVAALKGFQFVRLTPTSRSANSSSAFSEGWAVEMHRTPEQTAANHRLGASIQYADLTELMLMLGMRLGGGVMDAVNQGQRLVRPGAA